MNYKNKIRGMAAKASIRIENNTDKKKRVHISLNI